MDTIAIIIGTAWTFAGLLIIVLSIPLVRGRVPRNRLYGVRLHQSLQSDDAWYAINRFGGKRLIASAIPLVLLGIICFFLPLQRHMTLTLILGFAPLAFVLIAVGQVVWFAQRYEQRR
jgi:hypothetical protein